MRVDGDLALRGEIVWLTPEQGCRQSGPPATPEDMDYAATGFVPPATVENGLASFVLRVVDRAAWRSPATAQWLVVENDGVHRAGQGSVVIVTEGPRAVAYFHVAEVRAEKD